jgi:Big-like domain-containing protein/kelch motif-containing protein
LRKTLAALLVLALAALTWAAPEKGPSFLKVKTFRPRHGRTFVELDTVIQVKFSRPVDRATVTPQTVFLRKLTGEFVPVTYAEYRGDKIVALTPASQLDPSTDYQIVVRPGLMSADGRTLREERHANFFTVTRVSPLSILRPDQFKPAGNAMVEGRAAHSAILLADGRVLLAGGLSDYVAYATSGDLFDAFTDQFTSTGTQLHVQRAYHPCVRLGSGALLVGGSGASGALSSTEAFVAATSQFAVGPPMLEERDYVAAVTLRDGRIFVTGGLHYIPQGAVYSDTAEIYDPAGGSFRFTANAPLRRRAGHTATLLPDGRVLIVGGLSGGASTPVSAEIFDPVTETFTYTTSPPAAHRQLHTATPLGTGARVLFVDGGSGLLEMYDATLDGFFAAGGASSVTRTGATASLLPDGRVLIVGGLRDPGGLSIALDSIDLWVPSGGDNGSVLRASTVLPEPRYGHTATTLGDDRVLIAGGFGTASADSLTSGIVFTPDPAKK